MNMMTEVAPMVVFKCEVCNCNDVKYKCPRCEVQTCSLTCVKIHKKELDCNGIRDNTSFVPIAKFNNLNLLSDYRFLEGIDRAINNCRRDPHRWHTRYHTTLPAHLYKLKSAAIKRGIRLQYLPQHFTRHQENRTKLDYNTQEIDWKIDFIFPQGELIKISLVVNEKSRLSTVISQYLDPVNCPEMYKNFLKFYHAAGISEVEALLKAERVKDPKSVYMLDMTADINSNLRNKSIIENPVILIVKKAFKDEFTILEDNDAFDEELRGSKKRGYFGDFTPVTFFDSLHNEKKMKSKGDMAFDSVRESVALLRSKDADEDSEDEENDSLIPYKRPLLDIPLYDQLVQKSPQ